MPDLSLTKHHGQGNDFLVLLDPDDRHELDPATVRMLCDRHRGVGADGMLRGAPGSGGAAVTMDLRNADGGEAEMSGNGIRCLAQAVVQAGLVTGRVFVIDTPAGPREVEVRPHREPGTAWVSVDMGPARVGAELDGRAPAGVVPDGGWRARTVSMGNPHLVLLGSDLDGADLERTGLAAQEAYAGGINVELVTVGPAADELALQVWERGVGATLACGTGSCAAAAAAQAWGMVGDHVRVHSPGGIHEIGLAAGGVVLAGPVHRICRVEVSVP